MKRYEAVISGIAVYVAMSAAAALAREATAKSWSYVADQPPPKDQWDHPVSIREAVLWAVVSGVAAGLARVVVQRAAAAKGLGKTSARDNLPW